MAIMLGTSLYSFQEDYMIGKRDLEGCIKGACQEVGAPGLEVLFEETPLPDFMKNDRRVSPSDLRIWNRWIEKYNAVPTSYGSYLPHSIYANRVLTYREHFQFLKKDIKNAADLGFPVYRTGIFYKDELKMWEALLPYCEELGVQVAIEVHNPRGITTWYTQDWLEMIRRTDSPAAGFIIDFNIFCTGLSDPHIKAFGRQGGNIDIIEKIDAAHKAGTDLTDDEVIMMGGNDVDLNALKMVKMCYYDSPELLRDILPYCKHLHGKFLEINNGVERSIDYENIIRVLVEENWNGSISSEYEGQRAYFDEGCDIYVNPVDQVRKHQAMIKGYIDKFSAHIEQKF